MKSKVSTLILVIVLALLLQAGGLISAQSAAGEVIGNATGVPYVVKESINNGEPITLTVWDWWTARFKYFETATQKYTELYPNVTFDVLQSPGTEYWTKLAAAIPAGEGPDIFAFHNSSRAQYIDNNLVDPYPPELFDPEYLNENWIGFDEGRYQDAEGRVRYLPYGSMAALIFVNLDLWEAAGLTDADAPTTWDETLEVAKKLTQYNDAGLIDVSGFGFNTALTSMWYDMIYQQGEYAYSEDYQSCQLNTPNKVAALDTIQRFYDENVTSRDFPALTEAFGGGRIAMTYGWTWYASYLKVNFPELRFKSFLLPTFTGEAEPAVGRTNPDVTSVIPATTAPERKEVAWDFLHWLYSQDDVIIDLALVHSVAPAYKGVFDNPRVLENREAYLLTQRADYTVYVGDYPDAVDAAVDQVVDGNFMAGGMPNQEILDAANDTCNAALQEQTYWFIERQYAHDDLMNH